MLQWKMGVHIPNISLSFRAIFYFHDFFDGSKGSWSYETPNNWEMHLVGSPVAARSAEVGTLRGGRGKSADAWLFGGVGWWIHGDVG